jgi:flagellar basal body-associated protein FliL
MYDARAEREPRRMLTILLIVLLVLLLTGGIGYGYRGRRGL